MKKYLIILTLILAVTTGYTQENKYSMYGYIYDDITHKPISNAHIKIKDSNKGTVTNNRGYYSLILKKLPTDITITHVRYDTLNAHIKSLKTGQYNFNLKEHIYTCPSVSVSAKKPVNLVKKKFYDVTDYDFIDSNIVMLAYCYKEEKNPWLILMNTEGDTLFTQHVEHDGNLFRDCNDKFHILSKDSAYKFDLISDRFEFIDKMSIETFHNYYDPCITTLNNTTYSKQYFYHNQVLAYYTVSENDVVKDLKVIIDEVGLRRLFDRDRFHAMSAHGTTEADILFEEMCFFDPIFAPLIKVKDKICIINYVDSLIETYNKYGKLIDQAPVTFHLERNWKEEIYIDNVIGKVYTIYKKNGISTLKEINLDNGKLTKSVKIPDFHFIEKIKINDNNLYFLYRNNKPGDLMKLFKYRIG